MSERLFKNVDACQDMIVEALKYHLLPDRRQLMYSRRTQPRKSYIGQLFAFGANDSGKLITGPPTHSVGGQTSDARWCLSVCLSVVVVVCRL